MTALASAAGVIYIRAMPRLREASRDEANPLVRQSYTMADAFKQLAAALES